MIASLKKYEGLWLFLHSPTVIVAAVVAVLIILGALFASYIALVNPYDLASFNLFDGFCPLCGKTGQTRNTY